MHTQKLHAGTTFPALEATDLQGECRDLSKPQGGADWMMVVVYRGQHCPLCTRYLNELEGFKDKFKATGVDLAAVSADSHSQLQGHKAKLNVTFPLYYGLSVAQMQTLGLYISHPRSPQETDHPFAEPGLFVVNAQGALHVVDISNNPFVRPQLEALANGLAWIRNPDNHYPIRGTYPDTATNP